VPSYPDDAVLLPPEVMAEHRAAAATAFATPAIGAAIDPMIPPDRSLP
jgi:hypothetical protein